MGESKSPALPLGDAPTGLLERGGAGPARIPLATPVYRETSVISTTSRALFRLPNSPFGVLRAAPFRGNTACNGSTPANENRS
jgi:hypothetical protein